MTCFLTYFDTERKRYPHYPLLIPLFEIKEKDIKTERRRVIEPSIHLNKSETTEIERKKRTIDHTRCLWH